jgi:hypothetical protein
MEEDVDAGQSEQPPVTAPSDGPTLAPPTPSKALSISLAQVLVVVGAVAVVVSLFLHWLDLNFSFGGASLSRTANANGVPVQFLFDKNETADDPTILIVLIPAAALALLGAASHKKALVFIASIASLLVAGLYSYQLDRGLDDLSQAARGLVHFSLGDVIGIGPIVCGIGGLVMVVGAFLDRSPRPSDGSPTDR